jgi:hypothetical protein
VFDVAKLKAAPEGVTVKTKGNNIEIIASKKDIWFVPMQVLSLLILFGLLYLIVGFSFDLFTILCYLLFIAFCAWWIASNLLANFRVLLTKDKLELYEGMNQGKLIYSIAPKEIQEVKVHSERFRNSSGWYKGTDYYIYQLLFELRDGKSFVVGKTLMNDHKFYIHYFLEHYLSEA